MPVRALAELCCDGRVLQMQWIEVDEGAYDRHLKTPTWDILMG